MLLGATGAMLGNSIIPALPAGAQRVDYIEAGLDNGAYFPSVFMYRNRKIQITCRLISGHEGSLTGIDVRLGTGVTWYMCGYSQYSERVFIDVTTDKWAMAEWNWPGMYDGVHKPDMSLPSYRPYPHDDNTKNLVTIELRPTIWDGLAHGLEELRMIVNGSSNVYSGRLAFCPMASVPYVVYEGAIPFPMLSTRIGAHFDGRAYNSIAKGVVLYRVRIDNSNDLVPIRIPARDTNAEYEYEGALFDILDPTSGPSHNGLYTTSGSGRLIPGSLIY